MPTAGKLIGAIAFAVLAYFVSDLIKPYLDEGTQYGLLSPLNAFFGLIMGWRIMGNGAGRGFYSATGYGLTTVFATTFWCLLIWGGVEMMDNATRMRYDGPVDALQDMASIIFEYMKLIAKPDIIGTAIVGSVLCAWFAEFFARRFP
jgi:hypothetical protein